MKKQKQVPVSERAISQRLNRVLREKNQEIRKTREGTIARTNLGEWYIIDTEKNVVVYTNVDMEYHARYQKVLADWEKVC